MFVPLIGAKLEKMDSILVKMKIWEGLYVH